MAISLASLRQATSLTPPRILIHGVAGVGKSTFAANADHPVVIATEDGLGMLKVASFPVAKSFDEVMKVWRRSTASRTSSAPSSSTASTGSSR
jgi:hypothetical protein